MNTNEDKIANPLKFYQRPEEIEKDTSLSIEEKIKLLLNWLDDIRLRQVAEAENMPAADNSRTYVAEIEQLLHQYQLQHLHGN